MGLIGRTESDVSESFVITCEDHKNGEPRNVTHRNTNVICVTVSVSLIVTLTDLMKPLSNHNQEHSCTIRGTILYYILHKETILRPVPQCITVRYRKRNGLRCPTHENL